MGELLSKEANFVIPAIVITEFYSKAISFKEAVLLNTLLGKATIITPIDYKIARLAGDLRLKYSKFKLGDALIAATTIATGSVLVTNNMRDFTMIDGLKIV